MPHRPHHKPHRQCFESHKKQWAQALHAVQAAAAVRAELELSAVCPAEHAVMLAMLHHQCLSLAWRSVGPAAWSLQRQEVALVLVAPAHGEYFTTAAHGECVITAVNSPIVYKHSPITQC